LTVTLDRDDSRADGLDDALLRDAFGGEPRPETVGGALRPDAVGREPRPDGLDAALRRVGEGAVFV
jgi:hypothetical protein